MTDRLVGLNAGRRAFSNDPETYERARPAYPAAIFERLRSLAGTDVARILEIGPGTGQATRHLLAQASEEVVAVEPDARLAARLAASLGTYPHLTILGEPFEQVRPVPEAFDLVAAATSFHWLEQGPALRKVSDLLKPGGWFAMWWNVFGDPDNPDAFHRAATPLWRDLPASRSWPGDGGRPFALDNEARRDDLESAGFVSVESFQMRWTMMMTTAQVLDLASSFSQVVAVETSHRERFLRRLGDLVDHQFGGQVERRFMTSLHVGRKPPVPV